MIDENGFGTNLTELGVEWPQTDKRGGPVALPVVSPKPFQTNKQMYQFVQPGKKITELHWLLMHVPEVKVFQFGNHARDIFVRDTAACFPPDYRRMEPQVRENPTFSYFGMGPL